MSFITREAALGISADQQRVPVEVGDNLNRDEAQALLTDLAMGKFQSSSRELQAGPDDFLSRVERINLTDTIITQAYRAQIPVDDRVLVVEYRTHAADRGHYGGSYLGSDLSVAVWGPHSAKPWEDRPRQSWTYSDAEGFRGVFVGSELATILKSLDLTQAAPQN